MRKLQEKNKQTRKTYTVKIIVYVLQEHFYLKMSCLFHRLYAGYVIICEIFAAITMKMVSK